MLNILQALVIVFLLTILFARTTVQHSTKPNLLDWTFCVAMEKE